MRSPKKIGEGGYGCVFTPPIECEGESKRERELEQEQEVGKVFFNKNDEEAEWNIANTLSSLEGASDYLVFSKSRCYTNDEIIRDECDLYHDIHNNIDVPIQHIIPYGGLTLEEYIKNNKITYKKWLNILIEIFEALQFLNNNGYAHLDIKINNIVVSDRARLIDFGFMMRLEDIYKRLKQYSYRIYPLETPLKFAKNKIERNSLINAYLRNNDNPKLTTRTYYSIKRSMGNKSFAKVASPMIDVHSVGLMCKESAHKLLRKCQYINKPEYKEFIENITHIDYRKRYTPEKAIKHLRGMLAPLGASRRSSMLPVVTVVPDKLSRTRSSRESSFRSHEL